MTEPLRCPTSLTQPNGEPHTVIGPDDEGLYDCLDCGIWFDPTKEN